MVAQASRLGWDDNHVTYVEAPMKFLHWKIKLALALIGASAALYRPII